MAFIEWRDEYSVHDDRLDGHHRHLITLINSLHDAMLAGSQRSDVEDILVRLERYTQDHFIAEEIEMAAVNYPGLPVHRILHEQLIQQVGKLIADFRASRVTISMAIMEFLKSWLNDHILVSDRAYSPYLVKQGAR